MLSSLSLASQAASLTGGVKSILIALAWHCCYVAFHVECAWGCLNAGWGYSVALRSTNCQYYFNKDFAPPQS